MVENIRKVGNPLTIIAIFAALAEVAGTIVLGVVPPAIQSIFVWFVMGFPVLLIALFFGTLIWKADVLYAPSDFADEKNYMESKNRAGNLYDQVHLLRAQFAELTKRIDGVEEPAPAKATQIIAPKGDEATIMGDTAIHLSIKERVLEELKPGDVRHVSVNELLRVISATLNDVEKEAAAVATSQDKLPDAGEVRLWIILMTLKEASVSKLAETAQLSPKTVLMHLNRMMERGRAKRLSSGNWVPTPDNE